ncbi:hypothetical protein B0H16DRAFT_1768421 [Mycena metata]|uniref:Uncharacterized protein n=1 Tax=Mycena metata TaxID=1033252 RepID=A0AAD7I3V1_9AGAR|nr:hypothetical protein B0H16DRAFT_1768421 [Mycena metata]
MTTTYPSLPAGQFDALDVLNLNFRVTRSGRAFLPWDASPIETAAAFDIVTAVSAAVDVYGDEDLAEPDPTDDSDDSDDSDNASTGVARDLDRDEATLVHEAEDAEVTPQPPTASTSSSTSTKSTSRKKHDKDGSRHRRNEARAAVKPGPVVKTKLSLAKHRVASTGWIGLRDDGQSPQEEAIGFQKPSWTPTHTLPEFFGPHRIFNGFKLVKYLNPKPRPILDAAGRIFGLFSGHPDDPDWKKNVHDPAVAAMEEARAKCKVPEARTYHRRGNFFCLTAGDSHGNGHLAPGAVLKGVINTAVLCALLSNIAFFRMAGFATGVFANWAPNLFDFYLTQTRLFYRSCTHLWRPSSTAFGLPALSIWAPEPAPSAIGILQTWPLAEFPPDTTILIPSAAVFHSNIGIGPNDRRYSFSQYTARGIFRWIERGFQSEEDYLASLSREEQVQEQANAKARWAEGAGLFSPLQELRDLYNVAS